MLSHCLPAGRKLFIVQVKLSSLKSRIRIRIEHCSAFFFFQSRASFFFLSESSHTTRRPAACGPTTGDARTTTTKLGILAYQLHVHSSHQLPPPPVGSPSPLSSHGVEVAGGGVVEVGDSSGQGVEVGGGGEAVPLWWWARRTASTSAAVC